MDMSLLRDQWKQIRGDFKWWVITTKGSSWVAAVGVALMTAITTTWGWAQNLHGPYLLLLFLGTLAVCLTIAALCVFIANGLRQWWVFRQWERGERLTPSTSLEPESTAKDREIEELKKSIKQLTSPEGRTRTTQEVLDERWRRIQNMSPEGKKRMNEEMEKRLEEWNKERPPTDLTTDFVLQSISFLSNLQPKSPIKIVSIPEHREWAKKLAKIFRLSGYELLTSQEATDGIFPAKVKHDRFIIRFRAHEERSFDEEDWEKRAEERARYEVCHYTTHAIVLIDFQLTEFDSSSGIDYLQVEIKGAP